MTNEELRRLDAEVAAAVGWERWTCNDWSFKESVLWPPGSFALGWRPCGSEVPLAPNGAAGVPPFSSEWSVAGPLLEQFGLTLSPDVTGKRWIASRRNPESAAEVWAVSKWGETAPEAIARAVLAPDRARRFRRPQESALFPAS
jgi:hypothetical protein